MSALVVVAVASAETTARPPAAGLWRRASAAATLEIRERVAAGVRAQVLRTFKGGVAGEIVLAVDPDLELAAFPPGAVMVAMLSEPDISGAYHVLLSSGLPCFSIGARPPVPRAACEAVAAEVRALAQTNSPKAREQAVLEMLRSQYEFVVRAALDHLVYVLPQRRDAGLDLAASPSIRAGLRSCAMRDGAGSQCRHPYVQLLYGAASGRSGSSWDKALYQDLVRDAVEMLRRFPRDASVWQTLALLERARRSATDPGWDPTQFDPKWPTALATEGKACLPRMPSPDVLKHRLQQASGGDPAANHALVEFEAERARRLDECARLRTPEARDLAVSRWLEWYRSGAYLRVPRAADAPRTGHPAPTDASKQRAAPTPGTGASSPIR